MIHRGSPGSDLSLDPRWKPRLRSRIRTQSLLSRRMAGWRSDRRAALLDAVTHVDRPEWRARHPVLVNDRRVEVKTRRHRKAGSADCHQRQIANRSRIGYPIDEIVRRRDRKSDLCRRVDLARRHRESSPPHPKLPSPRISPVLGDKISHTDVLQRQVSDIDKLGANVQRTGPIVGGK